MLCHLCTVQDTGTFGEGLCLAEHWSSLWAPYSSCVGTATMMTSLLVLAGGKKDRGEQKKKKGMQDDEGCWEAKGGAAGGYGLGGTDGTATLSPLCVRKLVCHQRGNPYKQTTSPAGHVVITHRSNGDISNQPTPAANYGVNGVPLQVFTACFFTGTASMNYSLYSYLCLISQNALTKYKPELKSGFCQTSFKLSYKSTFSIYE